MASPEAVASQDTADFPKESSHSSHASRLIIKLKSLQTPKDEGESMTHEEVHYTPKYYFHSDLYKEKSREYVWE